LQGGGIVALIYAGGSTEVANLGASTIFVAGDGSEWLETGHSVTPVQPLGADGEVVVSLGNGTSTRVYYDGSYDDPI
jgi:hypothetical protein